MNEKLSADEWRLIHFIHVGFNTPSACCGVVYLERWAETIFKNSGFGIASLEPSAIDLAVAYNFNNDPFDSAIVAAAVDLSLPLITKDGAITESNLVEIHW